jgi:hypothetical protein
MDEIEQEVIVIIARMKGLYRELHELANLPCPDCGNETVIDGQTVHPGQGQVAKAIPNITGGVNFVPCPSCQGTGKLARVPGGILELNWLKESVNQSRVGFPPGYKG